MFGIRIDIARLLTSTSISRSGIDILLNSASNRQTPSLVGFGQKARALGEGAATQQTSNWKNTVGSLKRLIGRSLQDADVQEIEKNFISSELIDVNGEVGVKVRLAGETHEFSATQLMAMFLGNLRDTASAENNGTAVSDVVISTPAWFTDVQRRAMLDAADIAGLNTLRLINDTTATALGYGITKTDLPEADEPRNVVFCDIGHSSYQVSVVAFVKGELTILGTAQDRHFGGRDFDRALVNHFAKVFADKYKIDVFSNRKAVFRLSQAAERLKKVLSANTFAPINVESLMNDIDASGELKREEFEELIAPWLERVQVPLEAALAQSGLSKDEIHSIELVGGSSRVPAIKDRIAAFFGKPLSFTSNQDEAVCRGATLACAILSPVFRVREFSVHDTTPYPIKVTWDAVPDVPDEETELVVFKPNNPIPSTKILTFYRKADFGLEAIYAQPELLPKGINPHLGSVQIKGVKPDTKGDHSIVKVKARLNLHGVLNFDSAYIVEEIEKDVPIAGAAEGEPQTEKKKVLERKGDLQIVSSMNVRDEAVLRAMKEKEGELYAADKLVLDTEDRKNALEEYIYDQRGKLDERHKVFVQPEEKSKFLELLAQAEDWLYSEEGEDATKSTYVAKLEELQKVGNPIGYRWSEHEGRPKAAAALRESLSFYEQAVLGGDEKYAHVTDEDKTKVIEKVAKTQKWLDDGLVKQSEQPKNSDPKIHTADILKAKEDAQYVCGPIINKPKPRTPAPEPAKEAPKEEKPAEAEKADNMDVD